mgnify:FL=1
MATAKAINNIIPDLNGNLERDLNILVRAIITDLSTKQNSPVDTGFFASSWTASTQRPRPDQSRKEFSPWSNIKPRRQGDQSNPQAVIEPRFLDKISFNFKPFSKVFIGNRSEYAARALASPNSQIPQYVQGKLKRLINKTFTDKPKLAIGTYGSGVKYESKNVRDLQGFGLFGGSDDVFVDYTNP